MSRLHGNSGGPVVRLRSALFLGLLSIAIGAAARGEDRAGSLSRLLPARGLTFYIEYDGLDAHADAWKGTAAYDILGRTPAGAMMADVARRTLDRFLKAAPVKGLTGTDVVALQDHMTRKGFAFASYNESGRTSWVVILKDFGGKENRDRFDRLLRMVLKPEEGQPLSITLDLRGRKVCEFQRKPPVLGADVARLLPEPVPPPEAVPIPEPVPPAEPKPKPGPSWWIEGDALIFVQRPADVRLEDLLNSEQPRPESASLHKANVDAVLDAIEGKTPNASTNPGVVAALAEGRDLAGFEPNGLFVAESVKDEGVLDESLSLLTALIKGADDVDVAELIGLDQTRRVIGRWGFRGKALLTDIRFETEGPWKGLIGMLSPAGVPNAPLPTAVRGAGASVVGSFHRGLDPESLEAFRTRLMTDAHPYAQAAEQIFEDSANHRVITDLFESLGPVWSLCAKPDAVVAEVKDAAKTAAMLDAAAARLNAYFREQDFGRADEAKPDDPAPALVLERLPEPYRGYRLISPENRVPWLSDLIQPTIILDHSIAVATFNPALAHKFLSEKALRPSGEAAKAIECLPANLALLVVGNPHDSSWPEGIVKLRTGIASFLNDMFTSVPDLAPKDILSKLNVRPPAAPRPTENLNADALRSLVFPSVIAATVDGASIRFVSLEALPLGCLWVELTTKGEGVLKTFKLEVLFKSGK